MVGLILLRKILMKMMMMEEQQVIVNFDKKYIGQESNPKESNIKKSNLWKYSFIYENPDVIKEKYNGTTTMIVLAENFSESKEINKEEDKFKVYYFKSNEAIQYFLSRNPKGRLLNRPTSIEMNS